MAEELSKMPAPIPSTGDISVHLSYIRRDIDEIKHNQSLQATELKSQFSDLKNSYVGRIEFDDLKKEVETNTGVLTVVKEKSDNLMGKVMGGVAVIAFLVSLIAQLIGGKLFK